MKDHTQIERNTKRIAASKQRKLAAVSARIHLRMPATLSREVKRKAKANGLRFSQVVHRAILHELIQTIWEEVAMIDFTGCEDGDCTERIIYKTPDGELKSLSGDVVEDVSREQVARWIHQCVIPEEFEADFRVCARDAAE